MPLEETMEERGFETVDERDFRFDQIDAAEEQTKRIKSIKTGDDAKLFDDMGKGIDHAYTSLPEHKQKQMKGMKNVHDMTRKIYNIKAMSKIYGKEYGEIVKKYDQYKQQFGSKVLGMSDEIDDARFYDGVVKWRDDMVTKDKAKAIFSGQVYAAAVPHVLSGGQSSEFILNRMPPIQDADISKGEARRYALSTLKSIQERVEPNRKRVEKLIDLMKEDNNATEDGFSPRHPRELDDNERMIPAKAEMEKIIKEVSTLSEEEQDQFIWTFTKMAEQEPGVTDGFFDSNLSSLTRTTYDTYSRAYDTAAAGVARLKHDATNRPGSLWGRALRLNPIVDKGLEEAGVETTPLKEADPELHSEQRLKTKVRELKSVVAKLDDDSVSWMNEEWERASHGISGTLGYMGTMAIPKVGPAIIAADFTRQAYEELDRYSPDMSENDKERMALMFGAFNASVERLQLKGLTEGFPVTRKLLQRMKVKGALPTAIGASASGAVTETFQEHVQQGSVAVGQELISKIDPNISPAGRERLAKALTIDPEIVRVTVPLGILGGFGRVGLERIGLVEAKNYLANPLVMEVGGVSPEVAADIAETATKEGVYKAQKKLEVYQENTTKEELEANQKQAERDGKVKALRMQELQEQAENGKTQAIRDDAEAKIAFYEYLENNLSQIEEVDDGYYQLIYPEFENRPNDTFESEEEAIAAQEAYNADTAALLNGELVKSAENIEARQLAVGHLESAHEGAEGVIDDKKVTVEQAIKEGKASLDQMLERDRISALENGLKEGRNLRELMQSQILGEVKLRQAARGYVMRLHKGSSVATVFEEGSEGYIRDQIERGLVTMDFLKFHMGQIQKDSGEKLFEDPDNVSDQQAIEAFSKLARAHIWNNRDSSVLHPKLAALINSLRAFFRTVFKTADNLMELKKQGLLDEDIERHLDRSVGLDEDSILENERRKHERELLEEASDPDTEIQVLIKGKLPRPSDMQKGDLFYGEIKDLFDHFRRESRHKTTKDGKARVTSSRASALFAPKGSKIDLDMVRESLNEQGFDFDTPAEMLEALDDSLRGMKQFPVVDRRAMDEQEKGRTFSIGNTQVTPNDQTQSFPTEDGGVVGPATFSIQAFHGTPHKVDKFTTEAIGTGEGAQAFGWGLYFAENEKVAKIYHETLTPTEYEVNGQSLNLEDPSHFLAWAIDEGGDIYNAVEIIKNNKDKSLTTSAEKALNLVESLWEKGKYPELSTSPKKGAIYKVDLNVEESELLDWDKPLSEQGEKIKEALGFSEQEQKSLIKQLDELEASIDPETFEESGLQGQISSLEAKIRNYNPHGNEAYRRLQKEGLAKFDANVKRINARMSELAKIMSDDEVSGGYRKYKSDVGRKAAEEYDELMSERSSLDLADRQKWIDAGQKQVSKMLAKSGVRGIKFLDGNSRGNRSVEWKGDKSNYGELIEGIVQNYLDSSNGNVELAIRKLKDSPPEQYQEAARALESGDITPASSYNYVIFDDADITITHENGEVVDTSTFSITPAQDAAYMKAVEYGDVETQQRMVDEAAKAAGYGQEGYRAGVYRDDVALPPSARAAFGSGYYAAYGRGAEKLASEFDSELDTSLKGDDSISQRTEKVRVSIKNPLIYDSKTRELKVTPEEDAFIEAERQLWLAKNEAAAKASRIDESHLSYVRKKDLEKLGINGREKAIKEGVKGLNYYTVALQLMEDGRLPYDGIKAERPGVPQKGGSRYVSELVVPNKNQIKSADPITYDSSGNVIPLSERFNEQDDRITYSLAAPVDPVAEKIRSLMRDPDKRLAMYKTMEQKLRKIQDGIDERMIRKMFDDEDYNASKADVLESLAQLQAVVSVLPMEVRGKIGGWRKIASYKSRDGVERYLVDRLDKVDKELEKYLQKEYRERIGKILDKGKPTKGKNEKVAKGNLTPEVHTELQKIKIIFDMSDDKLAEEVTKTESRIQDLQAEEADTQEKQDDIDKDILEAEMHMARLTAYGKMNSKKDPMSSEGLALIYEDLDKMVTQGRVDWAIKMLKKKERRDTMADNVLHEVSGGEGTPKVDSADYKKKSEQEKRQRFRTFLKDYHAHNISFEHLLNWISRLSDSEAFGSYLNTEFGERVHKATHGEARAVAVATVELEHKIAEIFGIDPSKVGWHGKVIDKMAALAERKETGIIRYENIEREELKMSRADAEAVADGKTTKVDIDGELVDLSKGEVSRVQDQLNLHPKAKSIQIVRVKRKDPSEQYLSEDEMMFLTMMYRQEGLRDTMEYHGYDEDVMSQMETVMSDEAKVLRSWLFKKYDGNYEYFNDAFKEIFGLNLPKVKNYSPAKSYHRGKHAQEMIDADKGRMSTTPGMAMERIQHKAAPRNDISAIQTYIHHIEATEHFVHWADLVGDLRSVFNRKEVREAIIYHHGKDVYQTIVDRIEMFAAGGNPNAKPMVWLDKLRKNFTVAKLAYNWGVMLKQLTSLPAYMYDMDVWDYTKYQTEFFKNPIENLKFMWNLDYTQERWGSGYDRDVNLVLSQLDKQSKLGKVAHAGMKFGQAGDIVPVMVGGYAAYRNGYEKSKQRNPKADESVHHERGITAFEMATDRAQQSGHLKDQSDYALGHSLARVMTMFTTSPRQYMSNSVGSFIDLNAGREGAKKRFAKHMFISHVILPSLFHFASVGVRNAFKSDDEDEEYLGRSWVASMLLGPLSGYFVLGHGLASISSGYSYQMPVLETFKELGKGGKGAVDILSAVIDENDEVTTRDVIDTLDALATSASLWMGEGALLYDIAKGRMKSFGVDKDDLERLTMNEVDGQVHDLGEVWNKAKKEHAKDPADPENKDYLDERYDFLAGEYQQVKDKYSHVWDEIAEGLREEKKLPKKLEELIE